MIPTGSAIHSRDPSALQLAQIAQELRRSPEFFFQQGAPEPEIVLWRECPADGSASSVQVQLIQLAEQFHRLKQLCGNPELPQFEFATGSAESFTFAKAEVLAHTFRNRYALGERPGQILLRVLEDFALPATPFPRKIRDLRKVSPQNHDARRLGRATKSLGVIGMCSDWQMFYLLSRMHYRAIAYTSNGTVNAVRYKVTEATKFLERRMKKFS